MAPTTRKFETVKRSEIWKPEKDGEVQEGTFLSVQMIMGKVMGNKPAEEFPTFNFVSDAKGDDSRGQPWSVSSAMLRGQMDLIPVGTYCRITSKGWVKKDNMINRSRDFEVATEHGIELLTPGKGHFSGGQVERITEDGEVVSAPTNGQQQPTGFSDQPHPADASGAE